jgi:hypothetical protein
MLMNAVTAGWLVYDTATATEALSQAVAELRYSLLACALFGLVGLPMKNMRRRNEPRQRAAQPGSTIPQILVELEMIAESGGAQNPGDGLCRHRDSV